MITRETATADLLEEVCSFLTTHFAVRPRLCFTPDTLLSGEDQIWVMKKRDIIGTIRYHTLGTLWISSRPVISLVDAFCVHPDYRKKGVGAYLLSALHKTANLEGRPFAMFLKEGRSLPILSPPMYSCHYLYRRLPENPITDHPHIFSLTPKQAHHWIQIYMTCQPNTLLIYRPNATNTCWRVYRHGIHTILACIQNTHQKMSSGQRIGWVTVWLESPAITPVIRHYASIALSESVQGYEWLWINSQWAGYPVDEPPPPWKRDGGFHWYTYQFTTSHSTDRGFGIMC